MSNIESLVKTMVTSIVDDIDAVSVVEAESDNGRLFEVKVGVDDVGKVIGKKGRNVGSLRTLLSAATAKAGGKRALLEILE